MSELGRLLAEARTARELSLADVEAATRIRQKYLAALENGQFSALPHGPVARGFLRTYARHLGLDESDALLKYAQESGDAGDQVAVAEPGKPRLIDYRPVEVALTDGRPRLGWLRWVLALVVIGALGGGGWWLLSRTPGLSPLIAFGPAPRSTATTAAASAPRPTPVIVTAATATPPPPPTMQVTPLPTATSDLLPLPTPTVPPTLTPTPRATATPQVTRISITARITQRAWLRATVDGKVVMEENLEAGQVKTWEAEKSLALLTGNAGGIILTINNQEAGAMGALVQVVERTWVIQDGQIIEIAPGTATPTPKPTLTPTPAG